MGAPYALSQTAATPDILSAGRSVMLFGSIPGVADDGLNSSGGAGLSIKGIDVMIPGLTIPQIRVPLLGFTRAFRGHFDHQNHFSMVFYEDSRGGTQNTLFSWQQRVRNPDDGTGPDTAGYAIAQVSYEVYTVTGAVAFGFNFRNVWPMNVTPPASTDDGMTPIRINCDFSTDDIRFVQGTMSVEQAVAAVSK